MCILKIHCFLIFSLSKILFFFKFEWAWQNPLISKRLNHMKKIRGEKKFDFKMRALSEMLNTGPWNRLPLTIQWLKQEYQQNFPVNKPPPIHIPIAYGPLRLAKDTSKNTQEKIQEETSKLCYFCNNEKEGSEVNSIIIYL